MEPLGRARQAFAARRWEAAYAAYRSADGLDGDYDLALQYTDSPVLREGTVTTPAGVVGWFETSPAGIEMVGRKYVVVHNGTGWVITYWTGDIDESGGQADRIIGTFAPA